MLASGDDGGVGQEVGISRPLGLLVVPTFLPGRLTPQLAPGLDSASRQTIVIHGRHDGATRLGAVLAVANRLAVADELALSDDEAVQAQGTEDEAVQAADAMGYPVVAKLLSRTITHKTDVGGVVLNLSSADAVRKAFEKMVATATEKRPDATITGIDISIFDTLLHVCPPERRASYVALNTFLANLVTSEMPLKMMR